MKSNVFLLSLVLFPAIIFAQDKKTVVPPPPPAPPAILVTAPALPAIPDTSALPVNAEVPHQPVPPPPPPAISVMPPVLLEKGVVPDKPAPIPSVPVIKK